MFNLFKLCEKKYIKYFVSKRSLMDFKYNWAIQAQI